jgi:hypothetical protein
MKNEQYTSKPVDKDHITSVDDLAHYIASRAIMNNDEGMIHVVEAYARCLDMQGDPRVEEYRCYIDCWKQISRNMYRHGGYLPTRSWPKEE